MGKEPQKPRPRSSSGSTSLFSSKPRSFKMDVRSPQAAVLKEAISQKLMEFLGSYTDDVLAEYIVVLVCNGKDQNQANDDLEAFLGDKSADFIMWLWHHLFEQRKLLTSTSKPPALNDGHIVTSTSYADQECKKYSTASPQTHSGGCSHVPLPMDPNSEPSNILLTTSSSPAIDASENLERWNPHFSSSLTGEETQQQIQAAQWTSDTDTDHQNGETRIRYSDIRRSEILAGDDLGLRFENHIKKTARSKYIEGPHHLSPSLECFPVSRHMQSVGTEDPRARFPSKAENARRNLSLEGMDAAPYHSIKRRGSVWDRLGKAYEDSEGTIDAKNSRCNEERNMNIGEKRVVQHRIECLSGHTPIRKVTSENAVVDNLVGKSKSHINGVTNSINNSISLKRKRDFVEVGHGNISTSSSGHGCNGFQENDTSKKILRSASVRSSQVESLGSLTARAGGGGFCSMEDANIGSHLPNSRKLEPQLKNKASDFDSAGIRKPIEKPVKLSPPNYTAQQDHHAPDQSVILDMKLKLQQVEMEMLKLRQKQAKMSNDSKAFSGLASTAQGTQNHFEDIETRTIFVTNVHFAATKEDLSLHFGKYGAIINVVILIDTLTGLPKGSAYVIFADKNSTENALSSNGTSFFSRILKVVRKADVPLASTEQKRSPGKSSLPGYPQSLKKATFQRQFSGSHLQWKRDQPANG